MKRIYHFTFCLLSVLVCIFSQTGCQKLDQTVDAPLRVGISPYQDIAMIVNINHLNLEKKYNTKVELVTLPWEDIMPTVASAGKTVDIAFSSLIEYLTKQARVNSQLDDPVLFIYPAYAFKGGAFFSFNPKVPNLDKKALQDPRIIKEFLNYRIGASKHTSSEMMLYSLARRAKVPCDSINIIDVSYNDGILAAQNGSIDIAAAGLTQRCEALKRGGRIVLDMERMGMADISGFICKASTLKERRRDIDALIRMWYDCVHYVTADVDHNVYNTLDYLKKNASTKYTLAEYKQAIAQEYFPTSIKESRQTFMSTDGKYNLNRMSNEFGQYLVETGLEKTPPAAPKPITLEPINK